MPQSLPEEGPCHGTDERNCSIKSHHWRARVTGPKFDILVMQCKIHGRFFTVYPSGFVPYQQFAIANTEYGSSDLIQEEEPQMAFLNTLFQAANDAATEKPWARSWVAGRRTWWETQRRHIEKALTLLGLAPKMSTVESQAIARILDVDYLDIVEEKQKIAAKPGYQCRGQGVMSVLGVLAKRGSPLERLQLAGQCADLWGTPLWWDSESRIIRRVPFRVAGFE